MDSDLNSKIIIGLERISETIKTLLWEKAKIHGISPIQIQLLLFISSHKPALCNVSHLAREFNLTKPTVSDAIRVLDQKGLVRKDYSSADNRSYTLFISDSGALLMQELRAYSLPLETELGALPQEQLTAFYVTLTQLIFRLNRSGVLATQRSCFGCKFYDNNNSHFCVLLQKPLLDDDIKIDCPEFEE